jgi:Cof subfamily protein (haloacid dehalogenase superfamily)
VRNKGIRVSLCTGRVTRACTNVLDKLSLDGFHIFFDGALVYNPGLNREIYSKPIDSHIVKAACEAAESCGLQIELFSSTQYFADKESWKTALRRDFFGINSIITDFKTLWQKEKIIKGGIVINTPEEDPKYLRYCAELQDSLNITAAQTPAYPGLSFINITAPGVSKGKAVEALASHLDIKLEEIMAVGDGSNDVTLLSTAGLAVAMQNAPEELKSVCDHITGDVEESGVAQAVRKFLL